MIKLQCSCFVTRKPLKMSSFFYQPTTVNLSLTLSNCMQREREGGREWSKANKIIYTARKLKSQAAKSAAAIAVIFVLLLKKKKPHKFKKKREKHPIGDRYKSSLATRTRNYLDKWRQHRLQVKKNSSQ